MIGVPFIDLGRTAEALKEIEPAAAILERVVAEHPGMTGYRNDLAFAQMNLARAHRVLGRPADARRALERTHSIYERQPPDVMTLYNLVCTESLLSGLAKGSERDAYAVRAVATLRRTVAAGFRDVNSLRTDSDLDPLRSRPDFQTLLLDVAFPADPFAR
jgi:tetratricopeptide (TPR) repeat protein